ncbi:MAG: permease-like cell division protein FtsX [Bacillota bacterium]
MRLNTILYYLAEALVSIRRNTWLSLASVGTVVVSLFILGGSLLVVLNANALAGTVEAGVEIRVFLEEELDERQTLAVGEQIASLAGVEEVEFIPRDQALEELKESFGDRRDFLEDLETNPLPDTYRVKTLEVEQVPGVAREIEKIEKVEQVRYGQGVVEKLLSLTRWIRTAGLVAMGILAVASVFLIATTIRMSVYARRKEIGIMKTLGATDWFIRMPFVLEGMFLGAAGGLLALLFIYIGYFSLAGRVNSYLPFIQLITDRAELMPVFGGILGVSIVIGALGSSVSLRQFLKV